MFPFAPGPNLMTLNYMQSLSTVRDCWRCRDTIPSLSEIFDFQVSKTTFKDVMKIDYTIFVSLVNYLCKDRVDTSGNYTSFTKWRKNRRSTSVHADTAVAAGVLFLLGSGTISECALILRMSRSTFYHLANIIVDELLFISSEIIKIPPKEKQVFLYSPGLDNPFPGALFALDGTQVRCYCKGKSNEFYSRKGNAEINVQLLCDWNLNLVYVDANYTGRTHDNDAWSLCYLQQLIDSDKCPLRDGGFILADEGYATSGRVLRPYKRDSQETDKVLFNLAHKTARRKIENCIALWKNRVPLLNHGLRAVTPEQLVKNVHASAVLHQFIKFHEEAESDEAVLRYKEQVFIVPECFINKQGDNLRTAVKNYLQRQFPEAFMNYINKHPDFFNM